MPPGITPPNRMTMVTPPLPASAFDPAKPPPQSGMTVEFNRLFEDPKPPVPRQQQPPPAASKSSGMTVEFNRLFEPEPPSSNKTIQAPAPNQPVGEFTQMFQGGAGAPPPPPQKPGAFTQMMNAMPASQGQKPGGPRPNSYITAKEGESTQMFQAPQRTPPPPPPSANRPPTAQLPPQGAAGEFTQMFQRPNNPGAGGMPPTPPPQNQGEFTALFQNPLANPGGRTPDYAMPNLPPPQPQQAQRPSEFDELFGGVKAQPTPYQQPLPHGGGLSATSAFSAPPLGGAGMPPPPTPYGSSPLAPAAGGASYTQFMKTPGTQPALGLGQQPAKAPLPPVAAKKGIPAIVWIIGGVMLLLIIATITFFALRKH